MIREEKFKISKRPYAVHLGSYTLTTRERIRTEDVAIHSMVINAVWFRRRGGVLVATSGQLWDFIRDSKPQDVHEALERHDDGRYGGDWFARYDGTSCISKVPQPTSVMERELALLRPMLENYPAVPPGYSGWYRFETTAEIRARREEVRHLG